LILELRNTVLTSLVPSSLITGGYKTHLFQEVNRNLSRTLLRQSPHERTFLVIRSQISVTRRIELDNHKVDQVFLGWAGSRLLADQKTSTKTRSLSI